MIYYSKDHEWLKIDGNIATIGITNYAQEQLGDLVFVDLPAIGKKVRAMDAIVVVESVKAASDVYAPIDGEITAINENLTNQPQLINESSMDKGWIYQCTISNPNQLTELMDEAAYKAMIGG